MEAFVGTSAGEFGCRVGGQHVAKCGARAAGAAYGVARSGAASLRAQKVEVDGSSKKVQKKEDGKASANKKSAFSAGKVVSIGLSHHTATVEVREKLAVPEAEWCSAGNQLAELENVSEAAVLSTCNRFEVYFIADDERAGTQQVIQFLSKRSGIPIAELRTHLFVLTETEAVWHLFRVSSGLDSLVIGEGQILAQVKKCHELASQKDGSAGKVLNRLLITAITGGKRVRSETQIAKGAVSISSAAVELANISAVKDLGKPLDESNVCILGAGKMSRLLVQHLTSHGVGSITIVNRSMGRSEELSAMFPDANLKLRLMDEMLPSVGQADITFASTGASEPILTAENLNGVLTSKAMLIDISVPRNIAADVKEMSDSVQSYNVDDLKAVVAKNQARRRRLLVDAETLLREELSDFENWQHSLGSIPAITRLQERAECIRQEEMDKMNSKFASLTDSERAAVEKLTRGIVNKMIHGPMSHLRGIQDADQRVVVLRSLEAMFKL